MSVTPTAARGGQARFSACGHYRWWLERHWSRAGGGAAPAGDRLLFIGLNPSRADAGHDDPTLRRLVGFARAWGYTALEVVNLFGLITPSPAVLRRRPEPVGAENDRWIVERLRHCSAVWLGWGNGGLWRERHRQVLQLIQANAGDRAVGCLGVTGAGQPRHPLYAPADCRWRSWAEATNLSHPGPIRLLRSGPPCLEPPAATPCIST